MAAHLIDIAGVGGTSPSQASIFAVQNTIVLAIAVAIALDETRLYINPTYSESEAFSFHNATTTTRAHALVVRIFHDGSIWHAVITPRNPMAVHIGAVACAY